jgi:hypothetical protein
MKNILITTAIIAGVAMSASAVQAQTPGFNLGLRAGSAQTGLTLGYDFGSFNVGVQYGKDNSETGAGTSKTSYGVEALYNIDGPFSMGLGYYNEHKKKHYGLLARFTHGIGETMSVYAQTEVYTKQKAGQGPQNKDMFTNTVMGLTWNLG